MTHLLNSELFTYHNDEAQGDEGNDGADEHEICEDAAVVPRNVVTVIPAAVCPVVEVVDAMVSEVSGEMHMRNYQHLVVEQFILLRIDV